jgi:hypothetical protein
MPLVANIHSASGLCMYQNMKSAHEPAVRRTSPVGLTMRPGGLRRDPSVFYGDDSSALYFSSLTDDYPSFMNRTCCDQALLACG